MSALTDQECLVALFDELKKTKQENERLKEALGFYASNCLITKCKNTLINCACNPECMECDHALHDNGEVARKALGMETKE